MRDLVCRLLLEKKKNNKTPHPADIRRSVRVTRHARAVMFSFFALLLFVNNTPSPAFYPLSLPPPSPFTNTPHAVMLPAPPPPPHPPRLPLRRQGAPAVDHPPVKPSAAADAVNNMR